MAMFELIVGTFIIPTALTVLIFSVPFIILLVLYKVIVIVLDYRHKKARIKRAKE